MKHGTCKALTKKFLEVEREINSIKTVNREEKERKWTKRVRCYVHLYSMKQNMKEKEFIHEKSSTYSSNKDIHKYIWTQKTRNFLSIIDYVIVRLDTNLLLNDGRAFRGITGPYNYAEVSTKMMFMRQADVKTTNTPGMRKI